MFLNHHEIREFVSLDAENVRVRANLGALPRVDADEARVVQLLRGGADELEALHHQVRVLVWRVADAKKSPKLFFEIQKLHRSFFKSSRRRFQPANAPFQETGIEILSLRKSDAKMIVSILVIDIPLCSRRDSLAFHEKYMYN